MRAFFSRLGAGLRSPALRSLLLWCLPALLIGGALRGALMVKMPHAFYHPDSEQVFDTYRGLLHGALHIHEKKTPLGPLIYCLPPLLHLPVMPSIALLQHFVGLLTVVFIGALVAGSFARWRVFIIPATLAVALNPILLWYEHVALPETFYVCSITATALAGLHYARRPDWPRLALLALALFCTAGFRPEGKLYCLFGLALVGAVTWRDWARARLAVPAVLLLTALCFWVNQTRQSGSLLFSNVVQLTPAHLKSAPGFIEANQEYYDSVRAENPAVQMIKPPYYRNHMNKLLRDYLAARNGKDRATRDAVNKLCTRIGYEICLRGAAQMPGLLLHKYRFSLRFPAAEDFGEKFLFEHQLSALSGEINGEDALAKNETAPHEFVRIAYGRDFASRPELENYLRQIYRPFSPDWLTAWQNHYPALVGAFSLPTGNLGGLPLPGIPVLFLLAGAGLLGLAWRERRLRSYHLLWLGMLFGMALILTLTGSNLGRFRIGFEPFWVLYALALFDVAFSRGKVPAE